MDYRKYVVEFLGVFFLVLTIAYCATRQPGAGAIFAPFAVGAVLTAMVYAGGHVSGAHYNPAVSIAALARGKLSVSDIGPYIVAQVLAGAVAVALATSVLGPERSGDVAPDLAAPPIQAAAVLAEFLFTFALAWVVLNVATAPAAAGNSYFGIAIGLTVMAGAIAVGDISGAHFNPAVTIAEALMNGVVWPKVGLYLLAQGVAGFLAGILFRAIVLGGQQPAAR